MKKLINSSLLAFCALLSANQANGMFKACLKLGGLGVTSVFGKKYIYNPLKTQIKYRKYLASKKMQKLSDQLLDDHLKVHGGGFKKKLLVKYLKTFGYNRVYIMDTKQICKEVAKIPWITTKILTKVFGEKKNAFSRKNGVPGGLVDFKGGIYLNSVNKENKNWLTGALGHETAHQYRGDVTSFLRRNHTIFFKMKLLNRVNNSFKIKCLDARIKKIDRTLNGSAKIHLNIPEKLKNKRKLIKQKNSLIKQQRALQIQAKKTFISEAHKMEYSTCKTNIKTLFMSGRLAPIRALIGFFLSDSSPYDKGRLDGLREAVDKNPKHPLTSKVKQYYPSLHPAIPSFQQSLSISWFATKILWYSYLTQKLILQPLIRKYMATKTE